MKVTTKNYQELASRTMANLQTKAVDGAHMALGITTELIELAAGVKNNDLVNIREEHGDCNWYIANECNIYGFSFDELYKKAINIELPTFNIGELADLHKKELAYGKQIDLFKLENELVALIRTLVETCLKHGFNYEDSLQRNIDKLYKRYPEKFDSEKALNRNLEAEKKTLT